MTLLSLETLDVAHHTYSVESPGDRVSKTARYEPEMSVLSGRAGISDERHHVEDLVKGLRLDLRLTFFVNDTTGQISSFFKEGGTTQGGAG